MTKIYEHSNDLHVRATVIYVKANDAYAYADSDKTVKIDAATMHDLYLKGVVVRDGAIDYRPVSFGLATGVGTLTFVKTDGTTATTAVLATLKSKEYTAG